jgi:hypothetical protein
MLSPNTKIKVERKNDGDLLNKLVVECILKSHTLLYSFIAKELFFKRPHPFLSFPCHLPETIERISHWPSKVETVLMLKPLLIVHTSRLIAPMPTPVRLYGATLKTKSLLCEMKILRTLSVGKKMLNVLGTEKFRSS